jgi:hypothetical protein
MLKKVVTIVVLIGTLLSAAPAIAHDTFRIVGTLTRLNETSIAVKNADGKTTPIRLDKQTDVLRDKQKVERRELKVGLSVVVDAYGDSEADLLALEIRIVPPIAKKK